MGGSGFTAPGPVYSEFSLAHPFGEGSFATTVRVYPGMRRIDVHTQLVNNDKYVRYRVLFPTSIENGRRFDEIPFGAIERPLEQEYPAQYWMDYSDGSKGLALLNRGLPGNNVAGGTLLLSLMRSARITGLPLLSGDSSPVHLRTWAWSWALRGHLTTPWFLMPETGATPKCTRRDGNSIIPFWRAK